MSISFPTDKGLLQVLDEVKLEIQQGEFISLISHSGCGKSTVMNIVAGLLQATEGGVVLEDKEVTDPGPDRAEAVRFLHERHIRPVAKPDEGSGEEQTQWPESKLAANG